MRSSYAITLVSGLRTGFEQIQVSDTTAVMVESLRRRIEDLPQPATLHTGAQPVQVMLSVEREWTLVSMHPDGTTQRRKIAVAPLGLADLAGLPPHDRMALIGSFVLAGRSNVAAAFDDTAAADRHLRILFRMFPQVRVKSRFDDPQSGFHTCIFELVDPNRN